MIETRLRNGLLTVLDQRGEVLIEAHAEALLSDGTLLSSRQAEDGLEWQLDTSSAEANQVIVRLQLQWNGRPAVGVEQLRPLVAAAGYRRLPLAGLRIQQTGWQSWSRAHPPAPFEANFLTAAPPIRGPELPHRRADSQLESWMTVLVADEGPALLLGFTSGRHQLGTIEIVPRTDGGHRLLAATELDGTLPEAIISEPLLIAYGAPADLVDHYARTVADEMDARPCVDVLTGWCSWYEAYTDVTEADVERNLDSLAAERDRLPLRLIQLDDGYEQTIGDWLHVKSTFPSGLPALVERIHRQGYLAGVWLAPFLMSARSSVYALHPEWVVRDANGEPLNAIDNWGSANYALDTTHPAALEWLRQVVRTACLEWGFDYLKLDFVFAGAMRGRRYDPSVTAVEAYRRGMQALREEAGERFILGCGAPLVPSVGVVDGMRVGSDVAAFWGREGNADGPSLRNATRATLARMWMHGRWWTNDPDCVIVRASNTDLSLAEVQGWASVVALSGGMLFVGDDVSRVEPDRLALLARLWPPSGQAASTFEPLVGLLPERLHLRVERVWGAWSVIGIANWSDTETRVSFDPTTVDLPFADYLVFDLWSAAYLGRHTAPLDLGALAPHGVRLLSVHPALDRPQTIGSTGHLLGPAMDLAAEEWDPVASVLTLYPTGGPPSRQAEFSVYDPRGPIRRVPFSGADPHPIQLRFA